MYVCVCVCVCVCVFVLSLGKDISYLVKSLLTEKEKERKWKREIENERRGELGQSIARPSASYSNSPLSPRTTSSTSQRVQEPRSRTRPKHCWKFPEPGPELHRERTRLRSAHTSLSPFRRLGQAIIVTTTDAAAWFYNSTNIVKSLQNITLLSSDNPMTTMATAGRQQSRPTVSSSCCWTVQ